MYLLNHDLKGKKISVLGLSFKPNTDDIRESSAIVIIEKLILDGADVFGYITSKIFVNHLESSASSKNG